MPHAPGGPTSCGPGRFFQGADTTRYPTLRFAKNGATGVVASSKQKSHPEGWLFCLSERVRVSYSRSLRFQLIRSPSVVLEELEVLEEEEDLDL